MTATARPVPRETGRTGMNVVRIVVPLTPPSVNHYKMRTRKGVTFVSKEAQAFKEAVFYSSLHCVPPPWYGDKPDYQVEMTVFQGKGDKGDVDNYAKCVLDGLVNASVIHSDSAITDLIMHKRRDRENPRTEITVRAIQETA